MFELLAVPAVLGAVLLWYYMQGVQELALAAAKNHCREMGVQFLDGSVVRTKLRPVRAASGSMTLFQIFQFEFTVTGERRYRGETAFIGKQRVKMQLEPHAI